MEPVAQRSKNRCLNFLKGIACIGVVFIHVCFPGVTGVVAWRLSQFAVPLFLMIAGYYAFGCDENVVKRRLIKILKILTVGYLIYFAWGFGTSVLKGNGLEWLASNYGWNTLVKLIVFCTPSPIPIHLWYLIVMAEVYLLWFFVVQRKKEKILLPLVPLLFVFAVGLTLLCETNGFDWSYKTNFVARGLPYFLTGYFIHSKGNLFKISNRKLLLVILFSIPMMLIPDLMHFRINYACVFLIPYSIAIFLLGVNNPERFIFQSMEKIGSKLSLNIYIFHMLVSTLWGIFVTHLLHIGVESSAYQWTKPLMVVVCSIVLAFVINKAQEFLGNRK